MAGISTEALKEHAPLVPYIEKFYPNILIKNRSNNVCMAMCPFHDDKDSASLALYENGSWKCYGCGEYGDIITFVQKIENVDFRDACRMIASNVGFEIKEEPVNVAWLQYMETMDNHARRYWHNLQKDPNALNYLMNVRKLTNETMTEFRLGITDANEYKIRNDIGNISYRISIPLLEHTVNKPHTIGMAYRTLGDDKPKYINDKNMDGREGQNPNLNGVFIKGNVLYGYPQAKKAIRETGCVILVEGYFDVMSLHQSGIKNCVATMGTSLSENQIKALTSLTKNIIIFLDSDTPGINAMIKIFKQLYVYGLNILLCILDNPMDPDELCKACNFNGTEISNIMHSGYRDAFEYIISQRTEPFKKLISLERKRILNDISPVLNMINNPIEREMYQKILYKDIGL